MTAISAIVDILSVVSNITHQELVLINQLTNFFNFDHNIFLLDSSVDVNRFIRIKEDTELTPQSLFIFESADNVTKLESVKEIQSKNIFMILAPESVSFERNLNLLNQVKTIQRLNIQIKIGVFFSHTALKEDIQEFFKWFWKNRIINVFAATYSYSRMLNVFTFNPFGTFEIINVTGSETFKKFFLSQNSNFQKHLFVIAGGPGPLEKRSVRVWQTVLHIMNASVRMDHNIDQFFNYSMNSTIDFLPYLLITNPSKRRKFNLYPVMFNSMVLLVPEALPYSEFTSYLQAITSVAIFGYSFLGIAVVVLILTICRYIDQNKILFFGSVADVLNLLLNDNGQIRYGKLSLIELFIIVPLTFVGFVMVNGVFSTLQSHLTRPFLQPQIKTVEDIYQSHLVILTQMEAYKNAIIHVLTDLSPHTDWNDRIVIIKNLSILDARRLSYDTSVIHMLQVDKANRIIRFQKRLNIKGYYLLKQNIITTLGSYIAHPEFPFCERFNEIIHRIQSAGLFTQWLQLDQADIETSIVQANLKRLENNKEVDMERFSFPIFIVYGWIAGIIFFFIEIIWNNYKTIVRRFGNNSKIVIKKKKRRFL